MIPTSGVTPTTKAWAATRGTTSANHIAVPLPELRTHDGRHSRAKQGADFRANTAYRPLVAPTADDQPRVGHVHHLRHGPRILGKRVLGERLSLPDAVLLAVHQHILRPRRAALRR